MRVVGAQRDIFRMEAEAAWKRARDAEQDDEEDKDVNVIDDQPPSAPSAANDRPQKTLRMSIIGRTGHVLDDNGKVIESIENFIDPEDDPEEYEICEFCQKYTIYASGASIFVRMHRIVHGGLTEANHIPDALTKKYQASVHAMEKTFDPSHSCVGSQSCLTHNDNSEVLIAVDNSTDEVCGKIEYVIRDEIPGEPKHAFIRWMLVWPPDKHVGTGLLEHFEHHLRVDQADVCVIKLIVILDSAESDETVRRRFGFWARRGFRIDSFVMNKEEMTCRFSMSKHIGGARRG